LRINEGLINLNHTSKIIVLIKTLSKMISFKFETLIKITSAYSILLLPLKASINE
tara:strand:+ start:62 stop:226 length:165 start_codon:yes stop_codon:yes gene_type:complete